MTPHLKTDRVTVFHGDCLDVMRDLPTGSVDAIVTDPPYGLGFMGKQWDDLPPGTEWAEACLRVLKPGGHLLAFGGSRTWHRLAAAVEDAGFEIRDSIAWLYGSGFPKSLDVSKAIDKQRHDADEKLRVTSWLADAADRNGITRADVDAHMGTSDMGGWWLSRLRHRCAIPTLDQVPRLLEVLRLSPDEVPDDIRGLLIDLNGMKGQPGPAWFTREKVGQKSAGIAVPGERDRYTVGGSRSVLVDVTAPATPDAERWQGWGTALKPAFEPIVVGRKPLDGTVAANVLAHGTGALNIDGCRIEGEFKSGWSESGSKASDNDSMSGPNYARAPKPDNPIGRWPANVVLDESQAAELDAQSGTLTSGANPTRRGSDKSRDAYGDFTGQEECVAHRATDIGGASRFFYIAKADTAERPRINGTAHPTVKPIELMRWLVRLVTPPGGTVLEPFAGSGTTVEACLLEGFNCVAIEREADYLPLIESRVTRRVDPVRAVELSGDDPGLFEFL